MCVCVYQISKHKFNDTSTTELPSGISEWFTDVLHQNIISIMSMHKMKLTTQTGFEYKLKTDITTVLCRVPKNV